MKVIPAIDLKDGQVVRLYKGDYEKKKIYSDNPVKVAKQFENLKADFIHIVDLDGAKNGRNINTSVIKKIRENVSIPIEVGGGIRNEETVKLYLEELKVDRVILGTIAINNIEFVKEMIKKYGNEKIVVGVDIKNNFVAISGWEEKSKKYYFDFIKEIEQIGIKYIIVTDISKDGTLEGPSYKLYEEIKKNYNLNVIVSGGIKDIEDIKKISELDYYGLIIGKAYYEGKIRLEDIRK